jgi:glycolate oxidase FAD binding subunit
MINQKQQIFEPASEEEASQILQECSRSGRTVKIVGGGTKLDLGNPYAGTDVIISTLKLDKLIDYQPEDLTITVGAGMTFARLQEILAEQSQMLPLDPPDLAGQTLGGVLATNRSGPRRLLYGTARDLLIGCRFVLADGNIGHSGGRVVKNVAGYDLHKLFIGSYGTLGLLTEVTFKVVPKPQTIRIGYANFDTFELAFQTARQCVRSNLMPSVLEVVQGHRTHDYSCLLCFAVEGTKISVDGQLEKLTEICTKNNPTFIKIPDERDYWVFTRIAKISDPGIILLKASVILTDLAKVAAIFNTMENILELAAGMQAHAGTGIFYYYIGGEDDWLLADYKQLANKIEEIRTQIQKMGGSLVIERAPLELKKLVDAWGDFGDALPSMRTLKNKLDPQGLLNPGVMDLK